MHIPGHTLRADVAIATAAMTTPILIWAAAKARKEPQKLLPVLGFSLLLLGLQSINVPISGGTSAHLLGATLLAVLFGPYWGTIGIGSVYAVQAIFLGDGGLDALGANILNGGLMGSFIGFGIYQSLQGSSGSAVSKSFSLLVASGAAFLLGALACSSELAFSGFSDFKTVTQHMLSGSLAWAALEGGLSVLLANAYWAYEKQGLSMRRLALPVALAGFLSLAVQPWISSSKPDHLESFLQKNSSEGR